MDKKFFFKFTCITHQPRNFHFSFSVREIPVFRLALVVGGGGGVCTCAGIVACCCSCMATADSRGVGDDVTVSLVWFGCLITAPVLVGEFLSTAGDKMSSLLME